MLQVGVQTRGVVDDQDPAKGFRMLKTAGFSCVDFSLNSYLTNTSLYKMQPNDFFDQSEEELFRFFAPHKRGAEAAGIRIHQMHMPYPNYAPGGGKELNEYLWNIVAPKSMKICSFLGCSYIVVHGFKLARQLGSEEAEWDRTERFVHFLAPLAKEMGITICLENIYNSMGGHIVEGPCCNVRKVIERIDRINDQYGTEVLGFCFDTGHANLTGLDFEGFITALGFRLKVLHIHDNDGIDDLHQIPFTFSKNRENASSTDWEGFICGLRAVRFCQVLSFETAPVLTAFPDEMKADTLAFIARIGRYFAERTGEAIIKIR